MPKEERDIYIHEDDKYSVVLPTRKTSLEGFFRGDKVWVVHAIAKKYYVCKRCYSGIAIGEEHAVVRGTKEDYKGRTHHHYCMACVRNHVSPEMELRREIPSSQTSKGLIGKKSRKYRYSKRKRKS